MIHDPRLCCRQHGDRDCRLGTGAVACDRAGRAAAADLVGHRVRRRRFGHALHGDGGVTLYPFVTATVGRAGAVERSPRHRRRRRRVLHFRNIFACCCCPIRARAASGGRSAAAKPQHCMPRGRCAAMAAPCTARAGNGASDTPEFGRGTYAPLGGAGAPPRRFARHLPIERDGATHFRRRRGGGRDPCQCALHLCLQRHRQVVLPARHRRRRIPPRQQPLRADSQQPHRQYRPGGGLQAIRRQ